MQIIDPEADRAHTLPSSYYVDPAQLEIEKKQIFWRTWQVIGYREQAAKPGDYFTFDLVGEPLLVVRGIATASPNRWVSS